MRKRRSKIEPTPEDLEQGRTFAVWINQLADKMGVSFSRLSQMSGISAGYLYDLSRDGIKMVDGEGQYRRPSKEIILKLAETAGISADDGLRAAGYLGKTQPIVPSQLSGLPTDLQFRLAGILQDLSALYNPGGLVNLPIMGFAGAVGEGFNVFSDQHRLGLITLPASMIKKYPAEKCFIVRVRGNCLAGSLIGDGDFAVCVATETANDGEIVLVLDGDDAVLKRFREEMQGGKKVRWLETHEANGERYEHPTEGPTRIIGNLIALHREF